MKRHVEINFRGNDYILLFTTKARRRIADYLGDTDLNDILTSDDDETEAFCNFFYEMAKAGADVEGMPMPAFDANKIAVDLMPYEYPEMVNAIILAFNLGFHREVPEQYKDLVLEEIQKKNPTEEK